MCCNGGRSIRQTQSIVKSSDKVPIIRKVRRDNTSTPVSVDRQYQINRPTCPKCNYPTMLVHIAGRERSQCSNVNCRLVIK